MRGILNINKPKGLTSFDVIAKLRKILNIKKIGHAGTLDPLAVGVLPIFIGKATRLIQYVPKVKAYRAYARLGISTDTFDTEGTITNKKICNYDIKEIEKVLKSFEGKQLQTPPIYSAVSVNGKRLYEYARKKQEVEIPQKQIEIYKINFVDFEQNEEYPLLTFDISCASGVYVRSIINDLGEKLQSGAMMENLTRTMSANLYLKNSIELAMLTQDNYKDYLINANEMIDLPEIILDKRNYEKIKLGQFIFNDTIQSEEEFVKLTYENEIVAIGSLKENIVKPKTVLA